MANILLVDDENKICEFVKAYLDKDGHNTDVIYNGKDAIDNFDNKRYDLILLDRMLPDLSGEEICTYIRNKSNIPIIMLTAKIEDEDRIDGFNLGCDDYICKPFNVKELVLRVNAVLKRSMNATDNKDILRFDNILEINKSSHQVKINGQNVILTNTEYKILLTLACNPNKIYTREELLKATIEEYYEKMDRAIDSHIKNLRQKIEIDSKHSKIIQTVYGVGYKFGL